MSELKWSLLEDDFVNDKDNKKFTVLVIYDIISDKRRMQLSNLLTSYGYRVQKSSFECEMNLKQYKELIKFLNKYYEAEEKDLIRVYKFNNNTEKIAYGELLEEEIEEHYFL